MRNILYTAQLGLKHPIAIRYPRGRGVLIDWKKPFEEIKIGKADCLHKGTKLAVLSTGFIGNSVAEAIEGITESNKIAHYNFAFIKPLDVDLLNEILTNFDQLVTVEDGAITGGFGSAILEHASQMHYKGSVKRVGVPDEFISHGKVTELQQICKLSVPDLKQIFTDLL